MSESRWSLQRNDAFWRHHAHPVSLWIQLAVLPLYAVALWSRQWLDAGFLLLVAILFAISWVSARAFPEPRGTAAWSTRAVYGERIHASKGRWPLPVGRHGAIGMAVLGTAGAVVMVSGAILYDVWTTVIGVVWMLGAKLAYYHRMAKDYDLVAAERDDVRAWTR